MVTRTLRAYVELAAGLGEVTRARAVEAAQEIVAFAGSDPTPKQVAAQVTRLADDLLKAAEHNRDQVVSLVQREVESALARVDAGRVLGEVQSLGTTVAGLATQVDEIARAVGMRAGRPPGPGRADIAEPALAAPPVLDVMAPATTVASDGPATGTSATKAPAKKTSEKAPAKKTSEKTPAKKTPAEKTPAEKTPAKKTSAKKTPAKKTPAKKTSAKKTSAKETSAKKTSAKKAPATSSTRKAPGA